MSRYIDADALIETIRNFVDTMSVCTSTEYCTGLRFMKKQAIEAVENAPTVDAVPCAMCVKGDDHFKVGKIYPICGWNNGVHIIAVTERGDPFDLLCWNIGDELWDAEKYSDWECGEFNGATFVYCAHGERRPDEQQS